MAVGDLLQPAETEENPSRLNRWSKNQQNSLSALPRSVKLEITGPERNNDVISVLRGDFCSVLALVAVDVGSPAFLREPSSWVAPGKGKVCWSFIVPLSVSFRFARGRS
jgi:hypothetical protein